MKRFLLIIAMVAMIATKGMAQIVSVNTNVLMDAAMAPSFGFELALTKKSTFALDGFFSTNMVTKHVKVLALQPEWKYYFSGRPMYRHYIGIGAIGTRHKMRIRSRWYDGHMLGAGLTFGYAMPITDRFYIDFHSSLGFLVREDRTWLNKDNYPAYHTDENGMVYTNSHGTSLSPVKVGINMSYILK